jgi:hypothetical protein
VLLCALAACGPAVPGPDAAELETIFPSYVVPKSSPAAFVRTFAAVCGVAPSSQEAAARDLGYVPAEPPRRAGAPRLFAVDSTSPGLRLGDRLCVAEAVSRTGQTNAAMRHVARAHPDARDLPPEGPGVERLWRLPDGSLIATRRWRDGENLPRYALIRFRGDQT